MKRMPTSSIDAAVAAARAAAEGPLQPPPHVRLRPGDVEFWNSIVNARARDTWNEADLETAAALARCKADVERVQREVDSEGDVIVNSRGTPVVNPKHTLLETLTRRAVLLARQLQVHSLATVGPTEDLRKRNNTERKARAAHAEVESEIEEDLIPMRERVSERG